jgi:hypothetical protein
MAVTPLIKPITSRTGTFYAFQSGINHSNLVNSPDQYRFTYSKYALLRIPEIGVISESDFSEISVPNKVQFKALGDTPLTDGIQVGTVGESINLAESFQNYCLNMEAVLLSQPTYSNNSSNRTVSERIFFKWLKELGSIRFRESNSAEKNAQNTSENRFVEEDEYYDQTTGQYVGYNKVVKYINDISAVHTNSQDTVYSELYLYTPTDHGTTPYVLFKSISDNNYKQDTSYLNLANSNSNVEYLSGRTFEDTHPFGLSLKSYYDYDYDTDITYQIWNDIDEMYETGSWFMKTIGEVSTNTYITDKVFGAVSTQRLKKTESVSNYVEYLRTTLDGITIDWDLYNYSLANTNELMETFNDFNSYIGSKDFEYNAILIYYDLVDMNDPNNTITNLYGIQFLDTIQTYGTEHIISLSTKYKPDVLNKYNGTASSHKINFRNDTSYENAGIIKLLNTKTSGDYNTFSMDLYIDALSAMNNMAKSYENNITYITDLNKEITDLKKLFIDDQNKDEILARIKTIEDSIIASNSLFDTSDSIMQLIQDLYKKYNDILENKTVLDVRYNLEKSVINSLVDHTQMYNISESYKNNIVVNNVLKLNKYTNYYKHINPVGVNIVSLDSDLIIKIDDSIESWKYSQCYDIVFSGKFNANGHNVIITTDALNKSKSNAPYSVQIASLYSTDFNLSNNIPIFRIICIDPTKFIFEIDKIR